MGKQMFVVQGNRTGQISQRQSQFRLVQRRESHGRQRYGGVLGEGDTVGEVFVLFRLQITAGDVQPVRGKRRQRLYAARRAMSVQRRVNLVSHIDMGSEQRGSGNIFSRVVAAERSGMEGRRQRRSVD